MRFCLYFTVIFLLCGLAFSACGEEKVEPPLQFDPIYTSGNSSHPGQTEEQTPVFISAQRMEGKKEGQIEAVGEVELRKRGQAIFADHLLYSHDSKEVTADGAVRVEQDNNIMLTPRLQLNLQSGEGDLTQPLFQLGETHARGKAENMHLANRETYLLHNVVYTTCPADRDDWLLNVRELEIDRGSKLGVAHSARVEFMGVPILYSPWMDFALSGQRKSGFLGPIFGSTVKGGTDLTLPYFVNIAPNLDATVSPRILSKRGILLNNEIRYLEPAYSGEAHVDFLSGDRLSKGDNRSRLALNHLQNFDKGLTGAINFNRVSDDAYFRDLSDAVNGTSQTNLMREGLLTYAGEGWSIATRVQSFQTLQDPAAPVIEPYRRLPQLSVGVQRTYNKFNLSLDSEYVDFSHPSLVNGQRLVFYPSVSYPLVAHPAFYLTPKLGLHTTYYSLSEHNTASLPNSSRLLPIFSFDSGMTLEREIAIAQLHYVQTLEPRAYYVYIPLRKQNQLPNFDSAQADFSFAQIFTDNRFFGSDRIGDANQITLALTSRLIAPDSGAERLRVAIGQRFSAISPQVNLITPDATTNKSDILFAASGQMTRSWSLDSSFQYNPNRSQSQQYMISTQYQPESGKVLNLGYRFTRNNLRQMDLSSQWPLTAHWRGIGRWNYSIQDGSILEALGGLEYNQQCWSVRMVAQRFATATQQVSTGFFIQLELNDLVAVGSDPLSVLRQSIPGYSKVNSPSLDPLVQGLH
jgi:LPS-assembly protein